MPYIAEHNPSKCLQCGWCLEIVDCPGSQKDICIGCGACVLACPSQAIELVERPKGKEITIEVDGKPGQVPEQISIKEALKELGYQFSVIPVKTGIFAPCEVGGCWSCAVEVNGEIKRACVTEVEEGMCIKTNLSPDFTPRRLVLDFMGHPVGGVGTPYECRYSKKIYVEAGCFTAGCNFRCPTCYNWSTVYQGKGEPLSPSEAAKQLTEVRQKHNLDRMLISGGECTLNRPWLIQFIKELKMLNPDPKARFHIQTNGSLLTTDYIDELVDAGLTDVGLDLKGWETSTFMRITGLQDKNLAERYKNTAWQAVNYITEKYSNKVFLGIGIPYNKGLISLREITWIGKQLYQINPYIQIGVLCYVPDFRSNILPPTDDEMMEVYKTLKEIGLKIVLTWTSEGDIIGPYS